MNNHERKLLRAKAHHLKPIVLIGQAGISEKVLAEINLALDHHELVKVRNRELYRKLRQQAAETICEKTHAELVQRIGQVLVIYRQNPDKSEAKADKKSA